MNDYQTWLVDWFTRHAPQIALRIDDNYFNADAIDSFGVIELIEEMEQTFSVRFSQDDFQDQRFVSIGGLAALLREKTASS